MVVPDVTPVPVLATPREVTLVVVSDEKRVGSRSRNAYVLLSIKELVALFAPDVPPSWNVAEVLVPSHCWTMIVADARLDAASVVNVTSLGEAPAVPNVLVENVAERAPCCSTTPPT